MGIVTTFVWYPDYLFDWPIWDPRYTIPVSSLPMRGPDGGPLIIDVAQGYAVCELYYLEFFEISPAWHPYNAPLAPGTTDIVGSYTDDIIYGSEGINELYGEGGADIIQGRGGNDKLDGGPGTDTVDYSWATGGVTLSFTSTGDGGDSYGTFANFEIYIGSAFRDTFDARGGGGRQVIRAGAGNDTIIGGPGQDAMYGDDGDDTFEFTIRTDIDLVVSGETIDGGAGRDTILVGGTDVNFALASISSIEEVDFNLPYYTTQTNRAPFIARQTSATDLGSGFSQTLHVKGDGQAIDILQFHMNATPVLQLQSYTFENWLAGVDRVEVVGDNGRLDTVEGSQVNDYVDGWGGDDDLIGNAGDDTLSGGSGLDSLNGGGGNDTISGGGDRDGMEGGVGNDTLEGNAGNDLIISGRGNDRIFGGDGRDQITELFGRDTATGGAGGDTYEFATLAELGKGASRDVITDFRHKVDAIVLAHIDAAIGKRGDQDFVFIGKAPLGDIKGALHFRYAGNKTIVEGDRFGDGGVDFQIELTGHIRLTAGDFVL